VLAVTLQGCLKKYSSDNGVFQRCDKRVVLYSDSGVLSRLINTDQFFSS
jgi:hypothetical protein